MSALALLLAILLAANAIVSAVWREMSAVALSLIGLVLLLTPLAALKL